MALAHTTQQQWWGSDEEYIIVSHLVTDEQTIHLIVGHLATDERTITPVDRPPGQVLSSANDDGARLRFTVVNACDQFQLQLRYTRQGDLNCITLIYSEELMDSLTKSILYFCFFFVFINKHKNHTLVDTYVKFTRVFKRIQNHSMNNSNARRAQCLRRRRRQCRKYSSTVNKYGRLSTRPELPVCDAHRML